MKFLFRSKLPISYKPLTPNRRAGEGNDYSVFENFFTFKRDEAAQVYSSMEIQLLIDRFADEYNIRVKPNEVERLSRELKITPEQRKLVILFYMAFVSNKNTFTVMSVEKYYELLILMVRYLRKKDFKILPKLLLSNYEPTDFQYKNTLNKLLLRKIEESKIYSDILEQKYNFLSNRLNQGKTVYHLISPFLKYNRKILNQEKYMTLKGELIISETIRLLNLVIR